MPVGKHSDQTGTLREDEQFVIEHVARTYGGTWRPGEDPPDAYLTHGCGEIGIEISTLTQYVVNEKGGTKPRLSDDATALWLIRAVKASMRHLVPEGRTVVLTVPSPVRRAKKTKAHLETILLGHLATGKDVDCKEDVNGNAIGIVISSYDAPEKICGLVPHQYSNPDILHNARSILEDRIVEKITKCQSLKGPLWLALFNDYWLADDSTYRQAFEMQAPTHPFDKILIVSGSGIVEEL
jgi:hypothetical protein